MLKTLAKSIRQYKKTSVLSPVCVTFEVALECILPFYMTEMLDKIQLDNSTSAVDTKTDALIRKAFREEIPDTTKFIIAQKVSSVMDADKIILMKNGMVSDVGTHEELLACNPVYQEVYYSQNKIGNADAVKGGEDRE